MPTSAWFHALGGIPEAPGAVVVPLELGLELTHLRLVLDEEEGADLLSEYPHTGNQIPYGVDLNLAGFAPRRSPSRTQRYLVLRALWKVSRSRHLLMYRLKHH